MPLIERKNISCLILFMVSIPLFSWFAGNGWSQTMPAPVAGTNKVVAMVNETVIMHDDLDHEVNIDLRKYAKHGMKKASPELMKTLNRRALDRIIDTEVLSQAIREYKTPDLKDKVQSEFESMKATFSSPESFDQYLKSRNMTEESLLLSLKNKMQVNTYLESQGILHFEPSEEEIRSFYEERKESFKKAERVKVRHILIQVAENAEASEKSTAHQKAENIRKKILQGEDFGKLAEEYSDCRRSKNDGGNLGYIRHGFMPAAFDKVAFNIEKNTISGIVTSEYGYHVLEVLDREPGGYLQLDQVREYIIKYIDNKQVNKIRAEHVKELRKHADIQVFLE